MDETTRDEILRAIGLSGAMPADLRRKFGDEAVDAILHDGYAMIAPIRLKETDGGRTGSRSIETIELTEKGKKTIELA